MWTPETLPRFETGLPGLYLGIRMSWSHQVPIRRPSSTSSTPNFYGAAAQPMKEYWQLIDDCWTTVPEHAGCGFGYMRRFTPERLAEVRRRMDAAVTCLRNGHGIPPGEDRRRLAAAVGACS